MFRFTSYKERKENFKYAKMSKLISSRKKKVSRQKKWRGISRNKKLWNRSSRNSHRKAKKSWTWYEMGVPTSFIRFLSLPCQSALLSRNLWLTLHKHTYVRAMKMPNKLRWFVCKFECHSFVRKRKNQFLSYFQDHLRRHLCYILKCHTNNFCLAVDLAIWAFRCLPRESKGH